MGFREPATVAPDPQTGTNQPQLLHLLSFWRANRRGPRLPQRSQFTPETLRPWLGYIGIVDVERSPLRFRVRLAGMAIVALYGKDETGRYLDEIVPEYLRELVLDSYVRCAQSQSPQFTTSRTRHGDAARLLVRRLLLPVTLNDQDVDQIIVGIYADPLDLPTQDDWFAGRDVIHAVLHRT